MDGEDGGEVNVLILGGYGWLGDHFMKYFMERYDTSRLNRQECDITSLTATRAVLDELKPDVVINCAGKTHSATIPNIDGCIESLEARNETALVNAVGAGNVARVCADFGAKLVHIGSGCIFNGYDQIFDESSEPNPPSWYAISKVLGDQMVLGRYPDALILRIRMPISSVPHPRNLITKLAGARQVVDVKNTVTVVEDLLPFTERCLRMNVTRIVHAVHPHPITFRLLMRWYKEFVDPKWNGDFIPKEQYQTKDGRSNAVVVSTRFGLSDTDIAVRKALSQYGRNSQ